MSFILAPVSTPRPASSQPAQASARSEEPDSGGSESFGAVLSRSLAPAGEAAGKPEARSTTAAAAKRPADSRKAEPEELLNAMALPLIPAETLLPKALAAGTVAAAPGEGMAPGLAAPALAGLPAEKTLAADMAGEQLNLTVPAEAAEEAAPSLLPAALATGLASELQAMGPKEPGPAALATRTLAAEAGPNLTLTTAAIAAPSGAPDSGNAGQSPQQRDSASDLPQVAADLAGEQLNLTVPAEAAEEAAPALLPAALETGLAPELQAMGPKEPGTAALPTRTLAAEAGPSLTLTTAAIAAPSGAPDSGNAGQSPQQRDSASDLPQVAADTATGNSPKPDALQGMVKTSLAAMAATDTTPASAGAGISVNTSGQTASADLPAASATAAISQASVAAAPAPAALFAANAAPAAMARSLVPEVGSGEWGKALGQQMIHMGKGGEQVAELQLNPPGLGPLKVTLSMNEQQVQAMFVSSHSSVRAAVEAALPQLRSILADSGISLGNTSVNAESQQQTAFAQGQNGQNGQSAQRGYRAERTPDTPAPAVRPAMETSRPAGAGIRVDTYA